MKNFGKVKNDFANMPQDVVHSKISKTGCVGESDYDDTAEGIDRVVDKSISKIKSHRSYQK